MASRSRHVEQIIQVAAAVGAERLLANPFLQSIMPESAAPLTFLIGVVLTSSFVVFGYNLLFAVPQVRVRWRRSGSIADCSGEQIEQLYNGGIAASKYHLYVSVEGRSYVAKAIIKKLGATGTSLEVLFRQASVAVSREGRTSDGCQFLGASINFDLSGRVAGEGDFAWAEVGIAETTAIQGSTVDLEYKFSTARNRKLGLLRLIGWESCIRKIQLA